MFSINDIVRLKGEIGYDDLSDIDICFDDADEIIGRTGTLLTISLKSEGVVMFRDIGVYHIPLTWLELATKRIKTHPLTTFFKDSKDNA